MLAAGPDVGTGALLGRRNQLAVDVIQNLRTDAFRQRILGCSVRCLHVLGKGLKNTESARLSSSTPAFSRKEPVTTKQDRRSGKSGNA